MKDQLMIVCSNLILFLIHLSTIAHDGRQYGGLDTYLQGLRR